MKLERGKAGNISKIWNINVMAGTPAATVDHEAHLRLDARLGGRTEASWFPDATVEPPSQGGLSRVLSRVQLFATPWTAACQASLSFTASQSLLRLMSQ